MATDRFLIAPIQHGLKDDMRPWIIPDDAFERLTNAYVDKGRIRKRFGSRVLDESKDEGVQQLYSRVRIKLGTTDASGNISTTAPGAPYSNVGQLFSIADEIFTVYQSGTPADMYTTGSATTATYNTTTGAVVINGALALTDVYFYPALPIMGIKHYENDNINYEQLVVFDTKYAYYRASSGFERLGTAAWTGSDSQFFWTTNWRGVASSDTYLFVSNFNEADQFKYWDGTSWSSMNPIYDSSTGETIETAQIVITFKNRLLFLNTVETVAGVATSFVNRCRYSWFGDPTNVAAFYDDVAGHGDYLDAPTKEQIISADYLKDRLMVFFERSTWELVYTGNEVYPFRWQQINSELGVESPFSIVPFDKVLIGMGNVGIHACNGINVDRIDQDIEHLVFRIHNDNGGILRVHGIRDYYTQMVYWTYADSFRNPTYPTNVLTFNYETGTWGVNDDSITTFGYYQSNVDLTWASLDTTWAEQKSTWDSAQFDSNFSHVAAGNQQGFVLIIDSDVSKNAPSIAVTNISVSSPTVTVTAIDHNFSINEYVYVADCGGMTDLNGSIYQVTSVPSDHTFTIVAANAAGTYTGGGMLTRISRIDIMSKQYNFYSNTGQNTFISRAEFLVDTTATGKITVDAYPSFSDYSLLDAGSASGALLGDNVLETSPFADIPLESISQQVWHPVYLQAEGEAVQIRMYFTNEQMTDTSIVWEDFQVSAILFYVQKAGTRLQ